MVEDHRCGSYRILVVDDDEAVRRSVQKRLEKEGHVVIAVDNALDGLKMFQAASFDLVISDIRMPQMDGMTFLSHIRELDGALPVIMITGAPSLETAQTAVKQGAYDYILKPVDRDTLLASVGRALEKRHLSLQVEAHKRQLEQRVEVQTRVIRALLQMANELNAMESLQDVLSSVVEGAHRHLRAHRVMVLIGEEDSHLLKYARGTGVFEHRLRGQGISITDPNISVLLEAEEAVSMEPKGELPAGAIWEQLGEPPWLGVSVMHAGDILGVILVGEKDPPGPFTEDDRKILSYVGDAASVAIHNQLVMSRLRESYMQMMELLAFAVESKDPYTRGHSDRVRRYAIRLARKLGVPEEEVLIIGQAATLHDVGKVEMPDHLLRKPAKLTPKEYRDMKDHAVLGKIMVEGIPFLRDALPLIQYHHEKWDGSGYPEGKKGEEIPLGARIIAVADIYDALTTQRPYRSDISREKAILELRRQQGITLDPQLIEPFIEVLREMD